MSTGRPKGSSSTATKHPDSLTCSVEEAARKAGISRGKAYESARKFLEATDEETRRHEIPAIKIGTRTIRVPKERLHRRLDGDAV
jgi:limonene-1,2-epoxide hydrolase